MRILKIYFKKRYKKIVTLLGKQQESYEPKTFHKLRVEIKKLNALFDLLDCCAKNFKRNKPFRPYQKIFKQAGRIREIQIERTILEEHFTENPPIEYYNYLLNLQQNEQKLFFDIIEEFFWENHKKHNRKTAKLITKTNKEKVKKYLDNQRITIKKLLQKNKLKKKQIHNLRRKLKVYRYNLGSLKFTKRHKKNFKTDNFSELLGKWHDYRVIIRNLKKNIASDIVNTEEQQQLESIKMVFVAKSNLLLDTIYEIIHSHEFNKTNFS